MALVSKIMNKKTALLGVILVVVAIASLTLTDYRNMLSLNPDKIAILISYQGKEKLDMIMRGANWNSAKEILRWNYDTAGFTLYSDNNIIARSDWKVYKGTKIQTENTIGVDINYFDYGSVFIVQKTTPTIGGLLVERQYFTELIQIDNFPQKQSVNFVPIDGNKYKLQWNVSKIKLLPDTNTGVIKDVCELKFANNVEVNWCDFNKNVSKVTLTTTALKVDFKEAFGQQDLNVRLVDPNATNIDANIWEIDTNHGTKWNTSKTMPVFSYSADGNLTIDFNVASDTNFGYHYADLNYSEQNTQGTGTPIITGLKVDSNRCQTNFIGDWNNTANSDANLVAYYKFDKQEDDVNILRAFDYSGKGHHGQYYNGADNNASGKWDSNAGFFDAVNDSIDIIPTTSTNILTVMGWIYIINSDPFGSIISESTSNEIYINGTGNKLCWYGSTATCSTNAFSSNTWVHFAISDNASNVTYFANGKPNGTATQSLSTSFKYIGRSSIAGENFGGRIDELKIYDRALTAAEVSLDYNLSKRNFRSCKWDWNIMNITDANYYANVLARDNAGNSDYNSSNNNFQVNPSGAPATGTFTTKNGAAYSWFSGRSTQLRIPAQQQGGDYNGLINAKPDSGTITILAKIQNTLKTGVTLRINQINDYLTAKDLNSTLEATVGSTSIDLNIWVWADYNKVFGAIVDNNIMFYVNTTASVSSYKKLRFFLN